MDLGLRGRTVVVSGSTRGIGRAIAIQMEADVDEGAALAALSNLEALVQFLPGSLERQELGLAGVRGLKSLGRILNLAKHASVCVEGFEPLEAPVAPEHRSLRERHPRGRLSAGVEELDDHFAWRHERSLRQRRWRARRSNCSER